MLRALLPALLALAAWPAAAAAQDELLEPFDGLEYEGAPTRIARGGALTFAVRTDAPAGAVKIRVAGVGDTDDEGLLAGPEGASVDHDATPAADDPTLHVWRPPAGFLAHRRPGRYWWQAYVDGPAADSAIEPVGPVARFEVRQAASAVAARGPLHPAFGRRGAGAFYLSSAQFPDAVSGGRFAAVTGRAAARWGLRRLRWTSVSAGRRDGFDVAGFSTAVPKHALGMQVDYVSRRAGRIVERDLALRTGVAWAPGPAYPTLAEIDLESVLIHELGHLAGNKRHRRRCSNSPLVGALAEGEWWRGPRDRWFFGCGARASAAGPLAPRPRPLLHRTVVVD